MSEALDRLFALDPQPEAAPKPPAAPEKKAYVLPPDSGDVLAELPIHLLEDFPAEYHRFRPYTPEQMEAFQADIIARGILQPLLVRPLGGSRYQIIAGHNRRTAARQLGYTSVPCVVRELNDTEALLQMISTNLQQRTNLFPSEKAWAYRYQMAALNRQGIRRDLTGGQVGQKLSADNLTCGQLVHKSREDISDNESGRTVQRYIRLTYLLPELLEQVDAKKLGLKVGETLSYLSPESQQIVESFFFEQRVYPITQDVADKLRVLEGADELNEQALERQFLSPLVVKPLRSVSVKMKPIRKYFPENATQEEVIKTIEKALEAYFKGAGANN